MTSFHFLRPWWLLALLPFFTVLGWWWRNPPSLKAWTSICDAHLLKVLLQNKPLGSERLLALLMLGCSGFFMIISLAGPSWSQLLVPVYKETYPRVLILDMSNAMLAKDLSPDRLRRAKFYLHDILNHEDKGQFALIVYTGEPFIVSPLTEDRQTITALLPSLTADIMPIGGKKLDSALIEASKLITQAGFSNGQLLVLSATPPHNDAVEVAKNLAKKQIFTSILPVTSQHNLYPLFASLADAGRGMLLSPLNYSEDITVWLNKYKANNHLVQKKAQLSRWRDEGRWFLLPAFLFLLPAFRRGWLMRIGQCG